MSRATERGGMVPLFGAVPGGPEMLIILLVLMLLFFGPVLVLVVLGVRYFGSGSDARELERRVDELEAKVEAERGAVGRTAGDPAEPGSEDGTDSRERR